MGRDKISELSDCLLKKILSGLPIRDLVRTSVLSKRWRSLWLKVSEVDIDAIDFLPYGEALTRLINRFLEFESSIEKLKIKYIHYKSRRWDRYDCFLEFDRESYMQKLKIEHDDHICSKRVEKWIAEAVHRGVQHLDVEKETFVAERINVAKSEIKHEVDFMPKYMYVSNTLVSLKLVNVGLEDPKFDVSLPCLKTIHLENIHYKTHGLLILERFISGSTVLEDLTMDFPVSTKAEQIDFSENFILSMETETKPKPIPKELKYLWNRKKAVFTNVPLCLSLSLENVKINKLTMQDAEIKLVNYFLENSAVLKKLTLSLTDIEPERYKERLTSTKLSPTCQVRLSS